MKKYLFITLFIALSKTIPAGPCDTPILEVALQDKAPEKIPDEKLQESQTLPEGIIEIMKRHEEFSPEVIILDKPYIGYGHEVELGADRVTEEQADSLLRADIRINMNILATKNLRKFHKKLEHRYLILASVLAYNVGWVNVYKSKFLKKINEGYSDSEILEEFIGFHFWRGKPHVKLKRRRVEEAEAWLELY